MLLLVMAVVVGALLSGCWPLNHWWPLPFAEKERMIRGDWQVIPIFPMCSQTLDVFVDSDCRAEDSDGGVMNPLQLTPGHCVCFHNRSEHPVRIGWAAREEERPVDTDGTEIPPGGKYCWRVKSTAANQDFYYEILCKDPASGKYTIGGIGNPQAKVGGGG
jgi:hypothetical protein